MVEYKQNLDCVHDAGDDNVISQAGAQQGGSTGFVR
jgi:hypothetical protein